MFHKFIVLALFVTATHAAGLRPANAIQTNCGYCLCCSSMQTPQNPCCALGCSNRCQTMIIAANQFPTVPPSPSTDVALEISTSTALISPSSNLEEIQQFPTSSPCTIETCPPSVPINPMNPPPSNDQALGNIPQGPPSTQPRPAIQNAPSLSSAGNQGPQLSPTPCSSAPNAPNAPNALNAAPCSSPCSSLAASAPCAANQPCQTPCNVLPPREQLPCCFITILDGSAHIFCGCDGDGTCIDDPEKYIGTCQVKQRIPVSTPGKMLIPCYQGYLYGVNVTAIDGCPADGVVSSATGFTLFTSILALLACLFCCYF